MRSLAIIPARGGSKRIPRKNIKSFFGKPIIAYPIETALACGLFDEVMVSTDDPEIAEIAERYGAKVPFLRSNENANDTATTADVLVEVLNHYAQKDQLPNYFCCLYATTPLLSAQHLRDAMQRLIDEQLNCVLSVQAFSFPIQRAFRVNEDQHIAWANEQFALTRSQDLEKMYHDAGQFYCLKTAPFLATKKIVQNQTGFVELTEFDAQDIDNEQDWQLAEMKFRLKNAKL